MPIYCFFPTQCLNFLNPAPVSCYGINTKLYIYHLSLSTNISWGEKYILLYLYNTCLRQGFGLFSFQRVNINLSLKNGKLRLVSIYLKFQCSFFVHVLDKQNDMFSSIFLFPSSQTSFPLFPYSHTLFSCVSNLCFYS